MNTYLPTYQPTCLPTYLPPCLPAYLPTCLPIVNEGPNSGHFGIFVASNIKITPQVGGSGAIFQDFVSAGSRQSREALYRPPSTRNALLDRTEPLYQTRNWWDCGPTERRARCCVECATYFLPSGPHPGESRQYTSGTAPAPSLRRVGSFRSRCMFSPS